MRLRRRLRRRREVIALAARLRTADSGHDSEFAATHSEVLWPLSHTSPQPKARSATLTTPFCGHSRRVGFRVATTESDVPQREAGTQIIVVPGTQTQSRLSGRARTVVADAIIEEENIASC
jgi:hypothetical protein